MENKQKNTPNPHSKYKKLFWKFFGFGILGIILIFLLANFGAFGEMPTVEELENPDSNLASEIYTADEVLMGKYYTENRSPIKYEDLPQHLVDALVATEDERFYDHSGIDAKAIGRAISKMGRDGGGSTITQQLAKLLFHGADGEKNKFLRIPQKIKEWIIAIKLEKHYTKNEIIAMYFNRVDFVNHAVGIRTASRVYFGKEPKDLKPEESAVFVGMLVNPSKNNPNSEKFYNNSLNRRNTVFNQLVRNKKMTSEEAEKLKKLPIKLNFTPESNSDGLAPYFREYLRNYLKEWFKSHPKPDGSLYDVNKDGLKIYTSIDSKMQKYGEEAVLEHLSERQKYFFNEHRGRAGAPFYNISKAEREKIILNAMKASERWRFYKAAGLSNEEIVKTFSVKTKMKIFTYKGEKDTILTPRDSIIYYKHFLQTGFMAIEPQTGLIKTWVGGINFKHFQYDHVGQGARQVGSTFKPFVYAAAIDQFNMSPCDSILDARFTIPRGRHGLAQSWSPRNSSKYLGLTNLKKALAVSANSVSARLIDRVGPKAVIDFVKNLGVTAKIPETPAICLGAVDITVLEMLGAMSTFVNDGIYTKPQFITKIVDKKGNVIYEQFPESKDAMSPDVAQAVIKLMEGVTEDRGTSAKLRGGEYAFTNPIAGKTGTTNNNSDGWFIGMVPNLCAGAWVGCEDRSARFWSTSAGQGAEQALPIWGKFMKKCYNDKNLKISKEDFKVMEKPTIRVDCSRKVRDTTSFDQKIDEFNL
jgi:penicillin-binding protein 1A